MHRPGTELATSRSRVRRPNHYTTEQPVEHSHFLRWCGNISSLNAAVQLLFAKAISETKVVKFFWPTVFGRAFGAVCLSVTFCIVVKRYVLAKNCLKEQIGLPPESTPRYQVGPPIPPLMGITPYKRLCLFPYIHV